MKPFVFSPNALIDIWKRDTLSNGPLPPIDYESVPARCLRSYMVFGGPLNATGVNTFLHRLHVHPAIPLQDMIISNSDNANWVFQYHLDPTRLYFKFRYGGSIRESGLVVAHYIMAWPHYRQ